ncbi:MAG: hypothetical protein CMJ89_13235 [Planctomycetes bacterium]|jgi:hypothetical protein|nr:hypothetical protein [Planctomycetota bacterium]
MSLPPRKRPPLQLQGLAELVVADSGRPTAATAYRKPRVAPGSKNPVWRFYFAGWLGLMLGPIPIGHLAIGFLGLYFKLK